MDTQRVLFASQGLGIRPRTPSWDARGHLFEVVHRASPPPRSQGHDEADDDHDGTSVAETDGTDISGTSEITSHESLTSID